MPGERGTVWACPDHPPPGRLNPFTIMHPGPASSGPSRKRLRVPGTETSRPERLGPSGKILCGDRRASSSLLRGPLFLPASPGRVEVSGRLGGRGPTPPSHLAQTSRFPGASSWRQHLLPSRAGVCKLLGRPRPSQGAARDAVGKEKAERKKEKEEGE